MIAGMMRGSRREYTTRRTKEAKEKGKFYNLNTLTKQQHVRKF
jgi:hypothetical protein